MVAPRRLYTKICKIVYIVYTKKHKNVYSMYMKKHKIVYTTPLGLEQTMTIPTPRPLKRKFSEKIENWFHTDATHPLLVMGARRTGKTYLINQMGRQLAGDQFVPLDFQTDLAAVKRIFGGPTNDVDGIVKRLAEYKGAENLDPSRALLFFDEVQLDERALNSLRFFAGSRWRVIASGSLLGVTTRQRKLPFPSGVRQATLLPMDFEEFLWAMGEDAMARAIREHATSLEPYMLHDRALDLYHRYLIVGGMPLPVRQYRDTQSLEAASEELAEIESTYVADMTDVENGISGISAKRIWDSLPKQLLRSSTKKFKYSEVVRGGRRARLLEPLEWLAAAGIVNINDLTRDSQAPLAPYNDEEGSFFKVYVADTGVMFSKFGIAPGLFLNPELQASLSSDFRGALAENYVMQALKAAGLKTFYWMPEENAQRGEIDFIYQTKMAEAIPVEVKSARNVSAKTLSRFMKESRAPFGVRLSENEFGCTRLENGAELRSLPLYAAFCMDEME